MAQQAKVTKIYELKSLGYNSLEKELKNVRKLFSDIKKEKLGIEGKLFTASDADDMKDYREQLAKLAIEEQQLKVKTQELINQQKALNLQRQQSKKSIEAEAGSYNELYRQYRELYNLVKNTPKNGSLTFQGNLLSYDEAIKKLKQLASAEQAFRRQFTKDGTLVGEYTSGIIQAFKQMNLGELVKGQVDKAQERIKELNSAFDKLQDELRQTKAEGKKDLEPIEIQLIENRKEVLALQSEVKRLNTEMRGFGDIGSQIQKGLANGFKALKGQLASFVLQYIGLQAAISRIQQGFGEASTAADQTTDLEIQLDNSAEAADKLNKALAKLDTRTTVIGLQEIADIALKAGATAGNIEEVTVAFDKMKIAFGKDFGSIEQGVETTTKLINIFYNGDITGERILQIGNAIRALANETVASVPYLTDFSGRMAGLRQIANVSLPDILGLGAGFEEFKQSGEVASTVLVKIIPKLAEDVSKFAEIAGLTDEAFSKLLNNNPAEALIKVSEALVKSGKGIEEVSEAFSDSELGSGRITTILATLGGKADIFRQRIARAGETIQETGAITDAFAKKNNNLAASVDKAGKKLTDAFSSKGFQTIVLALTASLTFLISNLPIIIGLLAAFTVGILANNAALTLMRTRIIWCNLALAANYTLMGLLKVIYGAHIVLWTAYNAILKAVTATMRLFGVSAKTASGPLGVVIALVGLLASALAGINAATAQAITSLDEQNRRLRAMNEVNREASKIYTKQIAEIDSWVTVIKSSSTAIDTKKRAVEELTKINKNFGDVIKDNVIDLDKLDEAYKRVTEAIVAQAKAQASAELVAKRQEKLVAITALRQEIEINAARGNDFVKNTGDVTGIEKDILGQLQNASSTRDLFSPSNKTIAVTRKNLEKVLDELRKKEEEARVDFTDYLAVKKEADDNLQKFLDDQTVSATQVEVDIRKLKKEIEKLDKQIEKFRGSKSDLSKIVDSRDKKQKELDALLNRNQKTPRISASKISAGDKDLFRDIDAAKDAMLLRQEELFITLQIGEEQYLKNVFAINAKALDAKIQLLDGSNAIERNKEAEFALERIKQEKDLNDKLFEIRSNRLKDQLDLTIANAREEAELVSRDPDATESEKADAQLAADQKILDAQLIFNRDMNELEKKRNLSTKKNLEERLRIIRDAEYKITEDQRKATLARIEDEKKTGDKLLEEFRNVIARQRLAILESNKDAGTKREALTELDRQERIGTLARELATMKSQLPEYEKAYKQKAITEAEYLKFRTEYANKMAELNQLLAKGEEEITSVTELLSSKLRKLFNFKIDSAQAKLFADTMAQTYQLAENAMTAYFDAEKNQIDRSLDLQIKRLDIEKEQALARAESKEEEAAINREFSKKEEAANKAAFEKNKKLQREQAKINLAVQLSNLAVIAFAPNPQNIATLGVAGAIMYALQAAIAIANYALNIKRINSATYEQGGMPKGGGVIKGKSHAQGGVPFSVAEAERDELAIINKRSAFDNEVRTITGTNKQIASAINELGGGVAFAKGAKVSSFARGGYLGESLKAPAFRPAVTTVMAAADNSDLIAELQGLKEEVKNLAKEQKNLAQEQAGRIDRLQVVQQTSTVTNAQAKQVKQTSIGTL